ncbi:hypothetical protein EVAR_21407_1 [Eumeta japonica]|uniref:Uncharacterized protein n=1 Tax=Eumeta variegata TaxID=151549 RepID=A0A4C1VHP4_EUMVA|nr:hypothetical protein EVAR_21407_1 [Eumeta japonica]
MCIGRADPLMRCNRKLTTERLYEYCNNYSRHDVCSLVRTRTVYRGAKVWSKGKRAGEPFRVDRRSPPVTAGRRRSPPPPVEPQRNRQCAAGVSGRNKIPNRRSGIPHVFGFRIEYSKII